MRSANAKRTDRARVLRRVETEAERKLWSRRSNRQLAGWKFVRHEPIEPYFADFACREARLVVELDGSQHAESERDKVRDAFLVQRGYRVLRFWNHDVLRNMDSVLDTIFAALGGEYPSPRKRGEGRAPLVGGEASPKGEGDSTAALDSDAAPHPVASRLGLSPQAGRGERGE